jgi:hypothetical protein
MSKDVILEKGRHFMKDAALLGRPLLLKEGRHFMKKNVIL